MTLGTIGSARGQTLLTRAQPLEGRVPPCLELGCHEAIGRIDRLVATGDERHLVGGVLALDRPAAQFGL